MSKEVECKQGFEKRPLKGDRRTKPLFGVGINDVDYIVHYRSTSGKQISCPYYSTWSNMLMRCYSKKYQATKPTYVGCTVCEEWKTFSSFATWMEDKNWKDRALDKDLIVLDNKIYGPEYCTFLPTELNALLSTFNRPNKGLPTGVIKVGSKFKATCYSYGKRKHLGTFTSVSEASVAYKSFKMSYLREVVSLYESEIELFIPLLKVVERVEFDLYE